MSTKTSNKKNATTTKPVVKAKVSAYKVNVLNTNKALRQETKTLSGAVKNLWFFRTEIGLSPQYTKIVRAIMQDDVIYKAFKQNCRVSKSGNYAPFFVLQAIHKSLKPIKKAKK